MIVQTGVLEELALVIAAVGDDFAESELIQKNWNELGEEDPWQIC